MKHLQASCILAMSMALASCQSHALLAAHTEAVLSEGMKIIAATPSGNIEIQGQAGARRAYAGENWAKSAVLIPRQTRWDGSLGLYDPAPSNTLGDRLLVEEGRQHFSSQSEALRYMQRLKGYYGPLTYNNSGLVVAYKVVAIDHEKPTRSLQVWQIYINGQKPTVLPGAADAKLHISGGNTPAHSAPAAAPLGYARALAESEYSAD